jgi:hypothetical protein
VVTPFISSLMPIDEPCGSFYWAILANAALLGDLRWSRKSKIPPVPVVVKVEAEIEHGAGA